jgi:hypothetical protein
MKFQLVIQLMAGDSGERIGSGKDARYARAGAARASHP